MERKITPLSSLFAFTAYASLVLSAFLMPVKATQAKTVDRIAAVINDKAITLLELQDEMIKIAPALGFKDKNRKKLIGDKELQRKTLDHMINEIIIEDEIKKRGIEITDTELEMFMRNIMRQNGIKSMNDLHSALALQGLTMSEYKKSLRKQIIRTKIMNYAVRAKINLSEQDLKNYYMQHMDEAREPDTLHLKNIFIVKDSGKSTKKMAKAKRVLRKLKRGEKFEKLVKKYSEDANAKSGGDLGFMKADDIHPKIYKEVKDLGPGEHSGIIDTDSGYYIMKLVEKSKGEIRSFEAIKDELQNRLTATEMEKKFEAWLRELKSQSHIDIKI